LVAQAFLTQILQKSAKNRKEMESSGETSLTPRQLKFLPYYLSCRSIEEACRKAHVSRPTVYGWLEDGEFSEEVRKQKDLIYGRAIDSLSAGTDNAVAKLMKLLNSRNENIALRAAQSIITLAIKIKETQIADSQRAEGKKSETQLFAGEIVLAAWDKDEKARAEQRKVEFKAPPSKKG